MTYRKRLSTVALQFSIRFWIIGILSSVVGVLGLVGNTLSLIVLRKRWIYHQNNHCHLWWGYAKPHYDCLYNILEAKKLFPPSWEPRIGGKRTKTKLLYFSHFPYWKITGMYEDTTLGKHSQIIEEKNTCACYLDDILIKSSPTLPLSTSFDVPCLVEL